MDNAPVSEILIPALHPSIQLYKGPDHSDGTPSWTLHHPISNKYFLISWPEFECLARFHRFKNAESLIKAVNNETTIDVDAEDLQNLILFLHKNGLVSGADAFAPTSEGKLKQPFWKTILHHYLFFSFPLFKPHIFLRKTYPFIRPFFTKTFLLLVLVLFVFMAFLTLQRSDEFINTFFMYISLEGALTLGLLFMVIKIIHEFGHAYTAHKYGVAVPHMGVAFIVLYPVLYTETTGVWRLQSRQKRMHIGLAGITTELVIASFALLFWNILPAGPAQSLAFGIVAISLIGSLLVNLNPLMRFDGYYVLSDYLGIENLQSRAVNFARWYLREALFNLEEDKPEQLGSGKEKFLIHFGFALMVYRFFLFLGIAFLVYHIFFQPLGLTLMIVELAWFIAFPIWKELQIWKEKRKKIMKQPRTKFLIASLLAVCMILILPIHSSISIPAIYHAEKYRSIYPPAVSNITDIRIKDGDIVKKGDILMTLQSITLEKDIAVARLTLESLRNLKRREQTSPELFRQRRGSIDEEIIAASEKLESLEKLKDQLIIRAEFDGTILDMKTGIYSGNTVNPSQMLFRIVAEGTKVITAYATEDQIERININSNGIYRPEFSLLDKTYVQIKTFNAIDTPTLNWLELASVYSGPIASEFFNKNGKQEQLYPRQSLYAIELQITSPLDTSNNHKLITRGTVKLNGKRSSIIMAFAKRFYALILRETGFNNK